MEPEQSPNKAVVAIIVVMLLAAAGAGAFFILGDNNEAEKTAGGADTSVAAGSSSASSGEYQDGTYVATGTYLSPGGTEEIEVSVTLVDGVITGTEATAQAASGTSRQYQAEFVRSYKDLIVGKAIDEVRLDRVAGSSLTSAGFNEALDEIKQDAAV